MINRKDGFVKNQKAFFFELLHMKQKLIGFVILTAICLPTFLSDSFASSDSIKWYSFDEGIALGAAEGKKIYINFYADWCTYCKVMERETFKNPAVISQLNKNFISIKVDSDKEIKVSSIFRVQGLPDNWFLSEKGEKIGRRKGYITPDMFIKILKAVLEDSAQKKQN